MSFPHVKYIRPTPSRITPASTLNPQPHLLIIHSKTHISLSVESGPLRSPGLPANPAASPGGIIACAQGPHCRVLTSAFISHDTWRPIVPRNSFFKEVQRSALMVSFQRKQREACQSSPNSQHLEPKGWGPSCFLVKN